MASKELFEQIISSYTNDEIIHICQNLNKAYNVYDSEEIRWRKIAYCLFKTSEAEIDVLRRSILSNEFINNLFLKYYVCERVVKYYLIRKLLGLTNDIVAFEMAIGDSRIDVCRINGGSYAYEIKTEYDSFDRLSSQMNDYMKAFEKVYVVIPRSRVMDIQSFIPLECGIITYRQTENHGLIFSNFRRSKKHQCDINICLSSLSSNDLSEILKLAGLKYKGANKEDKLKTLVDYSENHSVWHHYRMMLKEKYRSNWQFIKDHFSEIIPIDIQNFFSTSINPSLLYNKTQKERS